MKKVNLIWRLQNEYTNKENKNHKQYDANLKPLWYLEDNS